MKAAPRGDEGENEFEAACARMGIPDEEIEVDPGDGDGEHGDGEVDERFGVWPENKRALDAFMAVQRLWRHHPMGGVVGLDRPSVKAELGMRKIKVDAALLDDLADIEGGVLEVWSAKS